MEQVSFENGFMYCGSGFGVDLKSLAEKHFGLERWTPGAAFLYLWRRFGPPINGSDPYKELCTYLLSTKNPDICLDVSPKSQASYSLRIGLKTELAQACVIEERESRRQTESFNKIMDVRGPIYDAFDEAIRELLRPTYVRDVYYNILGKCESIGEDEDTAEYSKNAGYGIALEYFDQFENEETNL